MKGHSWEPQEDYAVAFAAGLGLSARETAKALGNGYTRNMVIGRCHRIGISMNGYAIPRPSAEKERKVLQRLARKNLWTPEEEQILRDNFLSGRARLAELLPGRTIGAIAFRCHSLGLMLYNIRRFTSEHDAIIRERYLAHVPTEKIGQELGRSEGTIHQRILRLGLKRDSRKTRLAKRFGVDVLSISHAYPVDTYSA